MKLQRSHSMLIALIVWGALLLYSQASRQVLLYVVRLPFKVVVAATKVVALIPQLPQLMAQNAALKRQLIHSQLESAQLREYLRHAMRATQLPEYGGLPEGQMAGVVGNSPLPTQQVVLIDRGGYHGVEIGTVALDAGGVVGRVIEHTAGTATLLLITDTDSRIAAYVERSREKGLLVGLGQNRCELIYLDADSSVIEGDVVMTAGLGGPFHKGLVLGTVSKVERDKVRGTARAIVKPAAELTKLEEVYCVPPANAVTVF
jgi:rod shape-determining protein MreC